MAAFSLDKFDVALQAFTKGNELKPNATFKTWLRKCEAELGDGKATSTPTPTPTPATTTATPAAGSFK
ncbi:hypothetical protein M1146_00190 [Patescibacteria group bacterium]|nr:hypothetical protein [Patescibacteria group bacterium]